MKSNKELVYEYMSEITQREFVNEKRLFTTLELAESLKMQRTNISTYLNELVKENRVIKKPGKPVYYELSTSGHQTRKEDSCFQSCIGYDGSLKNAIQLAKAAILYPSHSLSTFLVGPGGSGKSYFAQLMCDFAKEKGVIKKDAPFVKFNCSYYEGAEEEIYESLFGKDREHEGAIYKAKGGILFLDHVELLPAKPRDVLFEQLNHQTKDIMDTILICSINSNARKSLLEVYGAEFVVRIDLPELSGRKLEERFELIQYFFSQEAASMKKVIHINAELLRCILLYHADQNVKQLKADIKLGCANAYVRQFDNSFQELTIYMNDFPPYVRKGFLYYKDNRQNIESLIPQNYSYSFSVEAMSKTEDSIFHKNEIHESVYDLIDKKVNELKKRGIKEEEISTIINTDLRQDLKLWNHQLVQGEMNKESISKIVDLRIVTLVEDLFYKASASLKRVFSESTFCVLCLHCSAVIERSNHRERLSKSKISETKQKYPQEVELCSEFVKKVEKEFEIRLPEDEVIFMTLLLCNNTDGEKGHPVVLIAMHGSSTASSISEVVNFLAEASNTYAFDLSLDKSMQEAYEELKQTLQEIDQGEGIIVLYDMGSIKNMIEMIIQETGLKIRLIEVPATLVALECSSIAIHSNSLEEVYQAVNHNLQIYSAEISNYERKKHSRAIITLCMSGQGGALQIKEYLEKHCSLEDVDIIALAVSDRAALFNKVNRIQKSQKILYFIGSYDPKLYGLPFISISQLFNTPTDKLNMLLALENSEPPKTVDFQAIYEYLSEQLPGFNISLLKRTLPRAISKMKRIAHGLTLDQEIGLFLHLACSIYRLQNKEETPVNIRKNLILSKNKRLYHELKEPMLSLEEDFEVLFNDDEMANIIGIIKKL